MKKTLVVYGSSTGTCQSIAETIAEKLGAEVVDVANLDDAQVTRRRISFSALQHGAPEKFRTIGMTD